MNRLALCCLVVVALGWPTTARAQFACCPYCCDDLTDAPAKQSPPRARTGIICGVREDCNFMARRLIPAFCEDGECVQYRVGAVAAEGDHCDYDDECLAGRDDCCDDWSCEDHACRKRPRFCSNGDACVATNTSGCTFAFPARDQKYDYRFGGLVRICGDGICAPSCV